MKIKSKLRLGLGFLFVMMLFFAILSGYYLNKISETSRVVLKNNYESLIYAGKMRSILDREPLPLKISAVKNFEKELRRQENNITETGEKEITEEIRSSFEKLKLTKANVPPEISTSLKINLQKIEELNISAIAQKNNRAQKMVNDAGLLLGIAGSVTFLILFSFLVNFPGFIANPIQELTEGIKEISRGNYRKRLEFNSNDEFSELASSFNQMALKLDDWENSNLAEIISEKLRIETIIKQMDDGVIGINEKGEIIFINPSAENLLNLKEEKTIGILASDASKVNDLLKTILEKTTFTSPLKIFANGKESYFQPEHHEIYVPTSGRNEEKAILQSSRSAGKVYILRNITKFKELDVAKSNFIATISHELKTPISSIKMSLKLLNDKRVGNLNDEQQGLLTHITEDTDRLLKITTELLDLSQVETGHIQLNLNAAKPETIVEYALNAVQFTADRKRITFHFRADKLLPEVHADMEKTAWVLVNFLSNAIRYSPENSKIIITVEGENDFVKFSVQDYGKGIEPQYLERLFERYFQVPTDGKNKSGSGLGLAISKDFIEAQSGEIFVISELGSGSTFGFRLPKLVQEQF